MRMVFKSVFNSLSEVQNKLENGRIEPENIIVRIDKYSLRVSLDNTEAFFEGYEEDKYYMSPDEPFRQQILFYDEFERPQELCVELISTVLTDDELGSVSYRGSEKSTAFL